MNINRSHNILWNKHYKIPIDLIRLIKSIMMEYYPNFDGGHNLNHAYNVINRALLYAEEYSKINKIKLNYNLVFVSAALHDIGLSLGRSQHHIHSGSIIKQKYYNILKQWFSNQELELIIESIEDHRNSLKGDPRSIYGRITSQADRDAPKNVKDLVIRSVLWGKKHLSNNEDRYNNTMNILYDDPDKTARTIRLDIPTVTNSYDRIDRLLSNRDKVSKEVRRLINKYNRGT